MSTEETLCRVDCSKAVQRFRMDMLRKMPFYGDILMRLPFVENRSIATARTDGRQIEYNPFFLAELKAGQWHYVLMHEVFHVLLFHCRRGRGRDPALWNTAADLLVNSMLDRLSPDLRKRGILFERPPSGIFGIADPLETVENVYESLRAMNDRWTLSRGRVRYKIRRGWNGCQEVDQPAPGDLLIGQGAASAGAEKDADDAQTAAAESAIASIVQEAAEKARGEMGSFYLPRQLLQPIQSKLINWKDLLRSFLTEDSSEESSYLTPERKYIHMDLILPGYSREEARIEELWAFVDSSGSIGQDELRQFLTQLSRICREFKCTIHLCYWDTAVTDVYRKINAEQKLWECMPKHSGGTDINCVYRWLRKEGISPALMLILTDGFFGKLQENCFLPKLKNNTILILSDRRSQTSEMKRIGKIALL